MVKSAENGGNFAVLLKIAENGGKSWSLRGSFGELRGICGEPSPSGTFGDLRGPSGDLRGRLEPSGSFGEPSGTFEDLRGTFGGPSGNLRGTFGEQRSPKTPQGPPKVSRSSPESKEKINNRRKWKKIRSSRLQKTKTKISSAMNLRSKKTATRRRG